MKKIIALIFIVLIFIFFALFIHSKSTMNIVLDIINPAVIEVDLNNNLIIDENETVCIPNIQTFTNTLDSNEVPEFAKNLSAKDIISLKYLADEYSRNLIYLKPIKVKFTNQKTAECRYGEIYIDDEKYSDKLVNAGYAARNDEFNKENFEKNIKLAEKLNLVILNMKSFKYHKTDCEYGLMSSDYTVLPKSQLPKDAKPCKFCHVKKPHKTNKNVPSLDSSTIYTIGKLELILTNHTTQLIPNNNCTSKVCLAVLDKINNAKSSIDVAAYGLSNVPKIIQALDNAKKRGVRLRLVYDTNSAPEKNYYKETEPLSKHFDVAKSDFNPNSITSTDKLMHNKFMIIDNETLITGSMNFSSTGLSGYNSNAVIIITAKDIAQLYENEFEQMLSGKFHGQKLPINLPHSFNIDNSKIDVCFSPYGRCITKIIPIIDNAKDYIYLPTFLITHTELTNALIRAKNRGVDVKIIIDANNTTTRNTKHAMIRANKIPLKTENYAGKLHSKSIIVDDKYIIMGSMNFSNSGETRNDENMLVIENTQLAKNYKQFFTQLWQKIPDIYLTKTISAEGKDSIGSCSDGIDNNFNGLTDKDDPACR